MSAIPSDVDWSATAAWIALAISITGTVLSPLVTAWLNNRQQLHMYKLKADEDRRTALNQARISSLETLIANIGKCIAHGNNQNLSDFGFSYFSAYQYISPEYWEKLDQLFSYICDCEFDAAKPLYLEITHVVSGLLKETPQEHP